MDKEQTLHAFWNSFGIPAYDESTVPDKADLAFPYITYDVKTDCFENVVQLSASIWDRGTSWKFITNKKDEIARRIGTNGWIVQKVDGGLMWIQMGTPFAQRMPDDDDMIRRIYLNLQVEFLTRT